MRNDTSRMPTLAWAGIAMVLVVVGWVAKTTVAQDRRQKPPPTAAVADPATPPPSLSEDLDVPTIKAAEPSNIVVSSPNFLDISQSASPASPPEPNQVSPRSSLEEIAAANDNSAGSRSASSASSASADPETAALVFVAENQKLAESQLRNLKDEESKLKARLLKVQAGIKRWESLAQALKRSQESVAVIESGVVRSRVESGLDPEPQHLEPVVPTSIPAFVPK
jgi:hypothetical protein